MDKDNILQWLASYCDCSCIHVFFWNWNASWQSVSCGNFNLVNNDNIRQQLYRVVHQVVYYLLFTSKQKFRHRIASSYYNATLNLMSTKHSVQPDGPPCTVKFYLGSLTMSVMVVEVMRMPMTTPAKTVRSLAEWQRTAPWVKRRRDIVKLSIVIAMTFLQSTFQLISFMATKVSRIQKLWQNCTACGHRITHRKWKETKLQPVTVGPGNRLGCCLVYFHFLCAILCPQVVF